MSAGVGMPDKAMRESHVLEQMGYLHRAIETLDAEISYLYERLTPVLRVEPEPPPEVGPEEEEIVPVAASIRNSRKSVDCQAHRLKMLRDRIEV